MYMTWDLENNLGTFIHIVILCVFGYEKALKIAHLFTNTRKCKICAFIHPSVY